MRAHPIPELLPHEQPKAKARLDVEQKFTVTCVCGSTGTAYLRHWERVRCSCGRAYWALQPKADGPLVLFAWPGDRYDENKPV